MSEVNRICSYTRADGKTIVRRTYSDGTSKYVIYTDSAQKEPEASVTPNEDMPLKEMLEKHEDKSKSGKKGK